MNIKQELESKLPADPTVQLNDKEVDPAQIRVIMINEVVPEDPSQDFYGSSGQQYLSTAIPLFQKAGLQVDSIDDILSMGIYITNAAKIPKTSYTVEADHFEKSLPWLEAELRLFPNVEVIMLMGDVAKKMFNRIVRKATKKNIIPSGATYKLRSTPYYFGSIRVMPSYIMTGGNLLIEKSKFSMVAEDLAVMAQFIQ